MFCGLLFTGWLCKLCIRTPVEIVEIALLLKCPKHLSKYLGHPGSLEYHMMLAVLVAAVQGGRSQQSVLDAGWELLTTSPSTELVFETDFFWFLKIFAGFSLTNESTDCFISFLPRQPVQLGGGVRPHSCLVCKEMLRL